MRGKIACLMLLVGLLLTASPTIAADELPEQVDGGVIVNLADGDRFKVSVSRDMSTVWGTRYDGASRSWGQRAVVLKQRNLSCGDVDARAAGDAVAVIAMCDKGTYYEDNAPTHSQALYSPDTVNWSTFTLPGEAYEEPGISPNGTNAVWPIYQGWVTRTAAGYAVIKHALPGQEYTITGTISDAGDVSILYGGERARGEECMVNVVTVPAVGAETLQQLDVYNSCSDVDLANTSATSAVQGDLGYPESQVVISRPDSASPWVVSEIAPETAPGLVNARGRFTSTQFVTAPGLPLLAVGSPDKKTFLAQTYDPVAQAWSAAVAIRRTSDPCKWGLNDHTKSVDVIALQLTCGKHQRLLVSTDAEQWHDVGLTSPLSVSPDGEFVSASNKARTLIFSRERGVVRLPLPTRARCDVIVPTSSDSALRLTTKNKRGWPGRLDVSTATGWRPTKTNFPRLRVGTDRCIEVHAELYEQTTSYFFLGHSHGVSLTVTPRGDGWKIRLGL